MGSRQEIANGSFKPKKSVNISDVVKVIESEEKDMKAKQIAAVASKEVVFNHTLVYNYTNTVINVLGLGALITIAVGIIRIDEFIRSSTI